MVGMSKRIHAMLKLFVRAGVTIAVTVLMIYLYFIFISVYQENQPLSDVKIATTVQELEIADPAETADVRWASRYERRQWRVVFKVDKVLYGRFEKPQLSFLVHSPSADLGIRKTGERVVLKRRAGEWQRDVTTD
jgi:hypothetical protein